MRVAVITPYFNEPLEVLRQCHASVGAQTHACTHFMVADGMPNADVARWEVQHVALPVTHGDMGNTPRVVGSVCASAQGFDAVAFLDADNFYYPEHIGAMIALHEKTGAEACAAAMAIHRIDGSFLGLSGETNSVTHIDTSAWFITRRAFSILPFWSSIPPQLGPISDRIFFSKVRIAGVRVAGAHVPTVAFRSKYASHYEFHGENAPRECAATQSRIDQATQWWHGLSPEARADYERQMGMRLELNAAAARA